MMWAQFIYALTPELIKFGRLLFARHKGNIEGAKSELKKIPDYWNTLDAKEAEIDQQLRLLQNK